MQSPIDPFYRAFGRRVRAAREPLMSQDLLARALGLGRTSVTNIEAGRQHVSLATAAAIARLLDVALDALIGTEERG